MTRTRNLRDAIDKHKSQGGFFKLTDDGDRAIARILCEGEEDLEWYVGHKVKIGNYDKWVRCTEEGDCPICLSNNRAQVRLFLQLIDKRDGQRKVWDRGEDIITKLLGYIEKYGPLVNRPYEIERFGKANDKNTKYDFSAMEKDDLHLSDFEERQPMLVRPSTETPNGVMLDLTYEEMMDVVDGRYRLPQANAGRDRFNRESSDSGGRDTRDSRGGREERRPERNRDDRAPREDARQPRRERAGERAGEREVF